ncbi:hypothetical protein CR513_28429, partial [Mucuna pruriens]
MKDELCRKGPILILGRPFLKITRTKIDVHAGTLSMVPVEEATRGYGIGIVKMDEAPLSNYKYKRRKYFGCKVFHIFSTLREDDNIERRHTFSGHLKTRFGTF